MEQIKKQLLNQFEIYYKEYKDYEQFVTRNLEEQKTPIKEKIQAMFGETATDEQAVELVTMSRVYPILYAQDLEHKKEEILTAFSMVEGLDLEIPAEIKTELQNLKEKKFPYMFTIKNGEPQPLNKERMDLIVKKAKTPEYIEQAMAFIKNLKALEEK